jgi:hypothetical protein
MSRVEFLSGRTKGKPLCQYQIPGQGLEKEKYPIPEKIMVKGRERKTTQFLIHNKYIFLTQIFNYFISEITLTETAF